MRVPRYSLPTLNWVPPGDAGARPAFSLEEILAGAAAAGFDAVGLEAATIARFTDGGGCLGDLPGMLGAHSLSCTDVGVLVVSGPDAPADAQRLAVLATAVGAEVCIVAWLTPGTSEGLRALQASADVLAASGVRLALEFVPYAGMPTPAQAIAACEAVGWDRCGVLADTWHFFRGGSPWALLHSLAGDQIALVHANDAPVPDGDDLARESRSRRLAPGSGTFQLGDFVTAMEAVGYDGVISAEVLSASLRARAPAEVAEELMAALRSHWPLPAPG